MEKINFVNKPNTDTPINDKNLNKMQDNIEKEILKTKVISVSKELVANEPSYIYPDYNVVNGTIIGSFIIGCVCVQSNNFITELIPYIIDERETSNAVSSFKITSGISQKVFVNILVFYK